MTHHFSSVNPSNELLFHTWPADDDVRIERALDAASALHLRWELEAPSTRVPLLLRFAEVLEKHNERCASLATQEMGKPIREARAELTKCAQAFRYYAEHGPALLADQTVPGVGFIARAPLGPILAIMPWNFPFWQLFRVAAPALLLGNPVVLKHAENVPGCARMIESLAREAGAPEGALTTLLVPRERTESIIKDPRIAAVTLTGSERAGSAVAAIAGAQLKPLVLELGGSDPFVVLADADLSQAVDSAVRARMQNSGQSCIAGKRFIIEAPIYDRFVRLFAERVGGLTCDDPVFESTQVGPIARADLLEELEDQVRHSVGFGARVVCGGKRRPGRGFFFEPTVLAEVRPEHRVFREEVFGPVAAVIRADDAEHAIALANDTNYGLGASIWTTQARGLELSRQLRAGNVGVNQIVRSDPRAPFGGIKRSGFGRELGLDGLLAFANTKTTITEG